MLLHGAIWTTEWFSLVVMVVKIVGLLDAVKREAEERQAIEAAARAAQDERDREVNLVIQTVSHAPTELADGDLSHDLDTPLAPPIRCLTSMRRSTACGLWSHRSVSDLMPSARAPPK